MPMHCLVFRQLDTNVDDSLIRVLVQGGNLVDPIHLPVQSGLVASLKITACKFLGVYYIEQSELLKLKNGR